MNVISIVSIVVSIVTAVAGFVFGMRQRDRRKSAESAMELQDDLFKTQTKATKTVVKEIADERSENIKKAEERKQEIRKTAPPDSVSERLDRLRK